MEKIKAVFFDMDGTLTNTLLTITNMINTLMAEEGYAAYDKEDIKYMVGDGYKLLVSRAVAGRNGDTSRLEALYSRYLKLYSVDFLAGSYIYDGVADALKTLKENGVKIAVLSNRPDEQTQVVIKTLFGDGFFDMVCGAVDEFALKPDTKYLEHILKTLDVSSEECLYFGDTATDMQTGKGAGLYTVGVLWGFRGREELLAEGADHLAETADELAELILR